jgi:hypothetical protein
MFRKALSGNPREQKPRLTLEQARKRLAILSILYLLLTLLFFNWLLFDTWMDAHTLFRLVGYDLSRLNSPFFHLVAYTVIGGAIGGIINGIRSVLMYYKGFDSNYFWKYIAAPWSGAALAIIGFAILRSTVAIFGGDVSGAPTDTSQALANFGIGALAGYGSRDVFIWLDKQVSKLFAVPETTPKVTGQPEPVAVSQIQSKNLEVGAVATVPAETPMDAGKVVDQAPAPGTPIDRGQSVDLVVTAPPNGDQPKDEPKDEPKSE